MNWYVNRQWWWSALSFEIIIEMLAKQLIRWPGVEREWSLTSAKNCTRFVLVTGVTPFATSADLVLHLICIQQNHSIVTVTVTEIFFAFWGTSYTLLNSTLNRLKLIDERIHLPFKQTKWNNRKPNENAKYLTKTIKSNANTSE